MPADPMFGPMFQPHHRAEAHAQRAHEGDALPMPHPFVLTSSILGNDQECQWVLPLPPLAGLLSLAHRHEKPVPVVPRTSGPLDSHLVSLHTSWRADRDG